MASPDEKRDIYASLMKGLDSASTREFSSAAYLVTEMDDVPRFKDDYGYRVGRGIRSPSLLHNLPVIIDRADSRGETGYRGVREMGEILAEYDVNEMALWLYGGRVDGEVPLGLEKKLDALESRGGDLDADLSEVASRLGEVSS